MFMFWAACFNSEWRWWFDDIRHTINVNWERAAMPVEAWGEKTQTELAYSLLSRLYKPERPTNLLGWMGDRAFLCWLWRSSFALNATICIGEITANPHLTLMRLQRNIAPYDLGRAPRPRWFFTAEPSETASGLAEFGFLFLLLSLSLCLADGCCCFIRCQPDWGNARWP